MAQLLLNSLVLQSQLLTLITHGAPLGDILVLHANDGLKAVLLLRFSLALKHINVLINCLAAELVRQDVSITGCFKLWIQTLIRRVICQGEKRTLVVAAYARREGRAASRSGLRLACLFAFAQERVLILSNFIRLSDRLI